MAWLAAKPKPNERSRRAKAGVKPVSRLEALKRANKTPAMPPNPAPHIVNRLVEMGLYDRSGMGPSPLTWCEIDAWKSGTCTRMDPWEARLIRRLSVDYVNELIEAEDEHRSEPWRGEITQADRDEEEAGLRALLG